MSNQFAEVAPAIPLSATGPQAYTYRVPALTARSLTNHTIVTVPFGRRQVTGVVTRIHSQPPSFAAKTIATVSPLALTQKQVLFARWLAQTMHGGLGYTLRLFKPPRLTCRKPATYYPRTRHPADPKIISALSNGPAAIIDYRSVSRHKLIRPLIYHFTHLDQQVLTLVPEKKLLPGPGLTYHAGLRSSALTAIWHGVKAGQVRAIRGTQKALFLPFQRLGLIIIEEEQNPAHKLWDQYPRLDNFDAVQTLARLHHCPILYLSSFPSWRLFYSVQHQQVSVVVNRPLILKTNSLAYTFSDRFNKYSLPHDLFIKLRTWSRARKKTLLLYERLDNKKIMQTMRANLSSTQLSYCHLSTSRVFANQQYSFDRVVWLFPEQSINFPDYRSVERAQNTVSRLQQLIQSKNSPVYLVTRHPRLIDQVFQDPSRARTQDLKLRQRLRLPPFTSQVRLDISTTQPRQTKNKSQKIYSLIQEKISQLPSVQAKTILLRGPYSPLDQINESNHRYIILRGPLEQLTSLYADLPITSAELTPHRLL